MIPLIWSRINFKDKVAGFRNLWRPR